MNKAARKLHKLLYYQIANNNLSRIKKVQLERCSNLPKKLYLFSHILDFKQKHPDNFRTYETKQFKLYIHLKINLQEQSQVENDHHSSYSYTLFCSLIRNEFEVIHKT